MKISDSPSPRQSEVHKADSAPRKKPGHIATAKATFNNELLAAHTKGRSVTFELPHSIDGVPSGKNFDAEVLGAFELAQCMASLTEHKISDGKSAQEKIDKMYDTLGRSDFLNGQENRMSHGENK